jgi:hypothetical protein
MEPQDIWNVGIFQNIRRHISDDIIFKAENVKYVTVFRMKIKQKNRVRGL